MKAHMTLEEAMAKEKGTLSQLVLKYTSVMKQLLDQAKDNPGFTTKSWAPLADMVDVVTSSGLAHGRRLSIGSNMRSS
jgi:hypothetical protein